MTYKEMGFRGVYHKFVAVEINDTLKSACKDFPCFEKANCVLGYGYIDHTCGTTLELLACGLQQKDNFEFFDSLLETRTFTRIGAVEEVQMIVISDEDGTLSKRYAERLEVLKFYNADENLMNTRTMEFLDQSRHQQYPDDLQLFLKTKDEGIEVCWLRIEGADDKALYGILLNEPNKECNCHEGDLIEFSLLETENGRLACVSEGTKRQAEPANENILKAAIMRFNNEGTNENLINILDMLRDILIWIPCNAVISDVDTERLKNAKAGMTFKSADDIRMIPDILQNGDAYFFPVFTSVNEMGDYGNNFSKIEKWFLEAIPLALNNEKGVSGIVINAFTDPFIVPNDLLKIILKQGSHLTVEEQ